MTHARGSFEVTITPQAQDAAEGAAIGRLTIDKRFHGDLEARSKGQMLAAGTAIEGSAGYVAIEQASGTLHGRSGSFVLQHSGTMARGAGRLVITVVPDSGAGELVGLVGEMTINIVDGKHFYDFEYTLAEST
jgi:flagellar basal body rod protein FlgG